MEKLFTTKEVMEMLKISRTTMYRFIEEGQLHALKMGRKLMFKESELERFIKGLETR